MKGMYGITVHKGRKGIQYSGAGNVWANVHMCYMFSREHSSVSFEIMNRALVDGGMKNLPISLQNQESSVLHSGK